MFYPNDELWKICTQESFWKFSPQQLHFDPKWKNMLKIRQLLKNGANPFLTDAKGNYLCNIMFTQCLMYVSKSS